MYNTKQDHQTLQYQIIEDHFEEEHLMAVEDNISEYHIHIPYSHYPFLNILIVLIRA